tara:strand:+ start:262 stop:498 length:237 start_codon:yes stop_codon:yes gene_type:complete
MKKIYIIKTAKVGQVLVLSKKANVYQITGLKTRREGQDINVDSRSCFIVLVDSSSYKSRYYDFVSKTRLTIGKGERRT